MTHGIRFSREAQQDLDRLYDFQLEQDLDRAEEAVDAIEAAMEVLEQFSFSCRKTAGGAHGPFLRELIVPFGTAGYVVLFEIDRDHVVTALAVRHQRESDYY